MVLMWYNTPMNNINRVLKKKKIQEINNISTQNSDMLIFNEFETFLQSVCSSDDMKLVKREQESIVTWFYKSNNINQNILSDKDALDRIQLIEKIINKIQPASPCQLYTLAELLLTVFNFALDEVADFYKIDMSSDTDFKYKSAFDDCIVNESDTDTLIKNVANMAIVALDCCKNASSAIEEQKYNESLQYLNIVASAIFIIYSYAETIMD